MSPYCTGLLCPLTAPDPRSAVRFVESVGVSPAFAIIGVITSPIAGRLVTSVGGSRGFCGSVVGLSAVASSVDCVEVEDVGEDVGEVEPS